MVESSAFDPVWEERYHDNPAYRNHYPWSSVVSFVSKNRPRAAVRDDLAIVEVGCGNGANLWFAAREGFRVAGIDGSATAVAYANEWFAREGLKGEISVGDFTRLPFDSGSFDLAIDRGALSFAPRPAIQAAIDELWRVLKPGGRLLFTPYSDRCTSFDGLPDADGAYRKVTIGSIVPGAQITFFGIEDVRRLFQSRWTIDRMVHKEEVDFLRPDRLTHAEWEVEVTKLAADG